MGCGWTLPYHSTDRTAMSCAIVQGENRTGRFSAGALISQSPLLGLLGLPWPRHLALLINASFAFCESALPFRLWVAEHYVEAVVSGGLDGGDDDDDDETVLFRRRGCHFEWVSLIHPVTGKRSTALVIMEIRRVLHREPLIINHHDHRRDLTPPLHAPSPRIPCKTLLELLLSPAAEPAQACSKAIE